MSSQPSTDLVFFIDEPQKDHFGAHLSCFFNKLSIQSFGILELFYESPYIFLMNASTDPVRILQPEFCWWGHVTNLPGVDESQLSGFRFAFFITIPTRFTALRWRC